MWIFLGALGMLFAAAIAGFLVVRLKAESWPPPGMPRLPRGLWVTTAILVGGGAGGLPVPSSAVTGAAAAVTPSAVTSRIRAE